MEIKIGSDLVGEDCKPYFIADIAANHDGDINRAFALIELAKESGADVAKFQNFKAKTIVSRNGFNTMGDQLSHQANWSKPVYEVYEDASLPDEWTSRLKEKCDAIGIEYMTSPYDLASVDLADEYSNCFKIGSGDITWTEILEYVAKKGKPVFLATGASTLEDVERAVAAVLRHNNKLILMQCNTNYTADESNFKHINLKVLETYRKLYPDIILGLSDHTHGYETVLGAIALGACVIEKHFTDDNSRDGPDHKFSMTPKTWKEMVKAASRLHCAIGDGTKRIEENETQTSVVQRRALYYSRDIAKGESLRMADIFPVRPINDGDIPPYEMQKFIGKTLIRDVESDTAVRWEDFQC